jgi:YedE family putative selenium metabolism protein
MPPRARVPQESPNWRARPEESMRSPGPIQETSEAPPSPAAPARGPASRTGGATLHSRACCETLLPSASRGSESAWSGWSACFLRDVGGSLGLFPSGPRYFRPEIAGLMLGALAAVLVRRRFRARSGSHAGARFVFGLWMAIGALVFLGCPFRLFQRLGGGDLNALVGAGGLLLGVGLGLAFERRGYDVGKTQDSPAPLGWLGHALVLTGLVFFVRGGVLFGPSAAEPTGAPAHAPWVLALGLAALAGVALSLTGFCGVNAMRQVFRGPRWMLGGALALVGAYALVALATGRFTLAFAGQPVAHQDHLWNVLGMTLVGLCGVLAGGCPVRQVVMAGEGNADAFVTSMGLVVGGALAHDLALVSSPEGSTPAGRVAVLLGLGFALVYGWTSVATRRAPAS